MIYDYACKGCDYREDIKQSIYDDELTVCPKCGGSIYRVIHNPITVYKGKGFYCTDNKVGE